MSQEKFSQDIHAQKGLTCASCHGGDPTSDDPDKAMSRKAGWKGKIDRKQIPQLCGSLPFRSGIYSAVQPQLAHGPVGQYHTSVHGKRLAAGDTKVAVCTDCHSVHDLRAPSDPRSTVNPVNVANTCARCHSDASLHEGILHSHGPVRKVQHERAPRSAGGARRSECANLYNVSWKPWRGAARSRQGSECVFELSHFPSPDVRKKFAQKSLSVGVSSRMRRVS